MGHIQFNNAEAHGVIAHMRQMIGERGPVSWNTWEKHYGQPIRPGRREEMERLALEFAGLMARHRVRLAGLSRSRAGSSGRSGRQPGGC